MQEYLGREVASKFEPALTFSMASLDSLDKYSDAQSNKIDFTFTDATTAACLESELLHSPLVTQRTYVTTSKGRRAVSEFGGVIVARKSRTDLKALQDLANRTIATPDLHLVEQHRPVLARVGVDAIADAGQLRVGNLDKILDDMRADKGEVDAAFLYAEFFI